jgi:hypothetical protein
MSKLSYRTHCLHNPLGPLALVLPAHWNPHSSLLPPPPGQPPRLQTTPALPELTSTNTRLPLLSPPPRTLPDISPALSLPLFPPSNRIPPSDLKINFSLPSKQCILSLECLAPLSHANQSAHLCIQGAREPVTRALNCLF